MTARENAALLCDIMASTPQMACLDYIAEELGIYNPETESTCDAVNMAAAAHAWLWLNANHQLATERFAEAAQLLREGWPKGYR